MSWIEVIAPFTASRSHLPKLFKPKLKSMADRSQRLSNGDCPLYGKQRPNEVAKVAHWRTRMANEALGMPRSSNSGGNASISMVWNPWTAQDPAAFPLASRKRQSEAKRINCLLYTSPSPRDS